MSEQPLLSVRHLSKTYSVRRSFSRAPSVRAVDDVSFEVRAGEAVGLVGESGSGKSTIAQCLLALVEPTSGEIELAGAPIERLLKDDALSFRRRVQMVFQMPQLSFDPHLSIYKSLALPLRRLRRDLDADQRSARIESTLRDVGLEDFLWHRHPGALSGGQLQRAAIARALVPDPSLVVLDEPTSALDLSVRGEVLALLQDLRQRREVAFLLITHDLDAVRWAADRLIVLYRGQVVETGGPEIARDMPSHPYTMALAAASRFDDAGVQLRPRGDDGPSDGCRLEQRCPFAQAACSERQPLQQVDAVSAVRCWRAVDGDGLAAVSTAGQTRV